MNEDITQEIYGILIKAGYEEKIAMHLCNDEYIKTNYLSNKKVAESIVYKKLIEFYKEAKDIITEIICLEDTFLFNLL